MADDAFYTDEHRALQDHFDTRRLADRVAEVVRHDTFTDRHRAFVESMPFFWLATADADGWPDVSYKGGRPGFVQVLDDRTLGFPSYDGNGMYRSMGNMTANARVGLLFVDFEQPRRLRVKGHATVHGGPLGDPDGLLRRWPGAELVVTVAAVSVFDNCPRYVHEMTTRELSPYAPEQGYQPPEPEWKQRPEFAPYLPGADNGGVDDGEAGDGEAGDGEAGVRSPRGR